MQKIVKTVPLFSHQSPKSSEIVEKLKSIVVSKLAQAQKNKNRINIEIPCLNQRVNLIKDYDSSCNAVNHFSEFLSNNAGLALLNDHPISMNKPLITSGVLQLLQFKDSRHDPTLINQSFWHACSLVLAATLETSFKESFNLRITHVPACSIEQGSFYAEFTTTEPLPILSIYDMESLSLVAQKLISLKLRFLPVSLDDIEAKTVLNLAEPITYAMIGDKFAYKIPDNSPELFANTSLFSRFSVTKLIEIEGAGKYNYRIFGVALPNAFVTHESTFEKLVHSSRQL
ncbi:hypothetical protein Ciccas_000870 [Cichlidogyrus casuarinus]|uniref:Uncharacterized protein n=1 Tax=Cichlidogyrus casuarinus TaxID=1844966 RepID=A0ABD2QM53_9PLAT